MPRYEVYATRWDDPHIIEELIPARGLEFSLPLSDSGRCSFSATVEPGRSFWRPSIAPLMSGVLIASDGVPVWQGWVIGEDEQGGRSFSFVGLEWGAFYDRVPAVTKTYAGWNDHAIFRDLITQAAAVKGQDVRLQLGSTRGASTSDLTINAWDDKTVGELLKSLSEAEGGPEWYVGTAGTLDDPQRILVLGDRLGLTDPFVTLEFVEDTAEPDASPTVPRVALLGNLFPVGTSVPALGRRGGNVLEPKRTRRTDTSLTQAIATGSGEEKARLVSTSIAQDLIDAGYPRLTGIRAYSDVTRKATLDRHARADLAAGRGVSTGWSLVTLDGDPVWSQVPRGSSVFVSLDTDRYGQARPVEFTTRLLDTVVRVDDDGPAQIEWVVAETMELV